MIFTQQNIVIYVLFPFKNNIIVKKTMGFILPKFNSIYTLNHLLYTRLRQMHLNKLLKQNNKATGSCFVALLVGPVYWNCTPDMVDKTRSVNLIVLTRLF